MYQPFGWTLSPGSSSVCVEALRLGAAVALPCSSLTAGKRIAEALTSLAWREHFGLARREHLGLARLSAPRLANPDITVQPMPIETWELRVCVLWEGYIRDEM